MASVNRHELCTCGTVGSPQPLSQPSMELASIIITGLYCIGIVLNISVVFKLGSSTVFVGKYSPLQYLGCCHCDCYRLKFKLK